mgnify:CR=1 FL=1
MNRLYQYNATNQVDPSLDIHYASILQAQCPLRGDVNIVQALDPITPFSFDNNYYKNLLLGKGLLASDEALYTDPQTKNIVKLFATNQERFFTSFTSAMVKLGNVGVKTGTQGNIRRNCAVFNS